MAEPNPDDGLVPEISELYKRDPAAWTREAERRTKLEATVEKLEELESTKEDEKKEDEEKVEASNNAAGNATNNASEKKVEESKKEASSSSDAKPQGESTVSKRKFKKFKSR